MKNYFFKKSIGHISLFIKSKSFKIRSTIIVFASLLLLGASPYFNGQSSTLTLLDHGPIAPYANGHFTDEASIDLSVTQRDTYPNLFFNSPIIYKPVAQQDRIILAQLLERGTSSAHIGYLKLKSSAVDSEYYTDFYFNTNATSGLDPGYDAALYNSNVPAFAIYSHLVEDNTGIPFMIQTLGEAELNDVTITLGVNASQGQEVTISIDQTDMPDTINVYLEDTSNNTLTLLNTNDYTFTAISDLTGVGRFYLRFENEVLSITNPTFDALNISTNKIENTIEVSGHLESQTSFALYDIHGRIILTNELNGTSTKQSVNVSHLSTGIYIVALETILGDKRVQKVIIR